MLKLATMVVGSAVALAGLLGTFGKSSVSEAGITPSVQKVTPQVRTTYKGMTMIQWHAAANRWRKVAQDRAEARDWLQKRLGIRVRELLALHRRFKAEPTRPPHYAQWLCIHEGEGAWTSNTGNGYYGGLQFAQGTWERNGGARYASRADLASPLEQMWIAESAWAESGGSFAQWPNTARACGLL